MRADSLASHLEKEQEEKGLVDGLPDYYIEIGKVLLDRAKPDFGSSFHRTKSTLEEVRKLRWSKILAIMTEPGHYKEAGENRV